MNIIKLCMSIALMVMTAGLNASDVAQSDHEPILCQSREDCFLPSGRLGYCCGARWDRSGKCQAVPCGRESLTL